MILAGVVLVGIMVIAVVALGGKAKKNDETSNTQKQTAKATPASSNRESSTRGTPGKKPDRPAPRLDVAQLAKARAYLKEGKALYNGAMSDWKSGKGAIDHSKLQECKDVLDRGRNIFDDVTMWDEEATMEGWAYPDYVNQYLRLWGDLSKVYAKAHKLSRAK